MGFLHVLRLTLRINANDPTILAAIIIIGLICVRCYFLQVIMGDRPAAERACKDPNPIIDGRKANVNLAILGAKPRVIPPSKLLTRYYIA